MSWKVRGTIKTNNEGHANIYQASGQVYEDQEVRNSVPRPFLPQEHSTKKDRS